MSLTRTRQDGPLRVYLAGKMRVDLPRNADVDDNWWGEGPEVEWRKRVTDWGSLDADEWSEFPPSPIRIPGIDAVATGPVMVTDNHGCDYHVREMCRAAVRSSDLVFAWIDATTCYGTLVEIGWAEAWGIEIAIAAPPFVGEGHHPLHDMWFVAGAVPSRDWVQTKTDPVEALTEVLHRHPRCNRARVLARMTYREYLQTPEWQERRGEALMRAQGRCQVCNKPYNLDVHHRTYERRGAEAPDDLTVLCRTCHATFHGRLSPSAAD